VQLASNNLEVLLAKNKLPTLTAANSFALSREPDISPATSLSSNVVRCRLCDSLTVVSGISHKEKTQTVSPTFELSEGAEALMGHHTVNQEMD
jgi:hypothetical protein